MLEALAIGLCIFIGRMLRRIEARIEILGIEVQDLRLVAGLVETVTSTARDSPSAALSSNRGIPTSTAAKMSAMAPVVAA